MERVNAPLERRFFETREQEEYYVALARGFRDVAEMRAHFAARETRSTADFERRLIVLDLENC